MIVTLRIQSMSWYAGCPEKPMRLVLENGVEIEVPYESVEFDV